jgi:RNA polymerase subunit RPABC4/transcription elongation factor Spt4
MEEHWICNSCGNSEQSQYGFCTRCGTARLSSGWTCPSCKSNGLSNEWRFCIVCGVERRSIRFDIQQWLETAMQMTKRYIMDVEGAKT